MTARIEVKHPSFGTSICSIGNISNGGMFIKSNDVELPDIGSVMLVQALDMPVEAPELEVKVVWKEPDGVGVEFCLQPSN
jgi:Tfp pilus assembly protein PilZ